MTLSLKAQALRTTSNVLDEQDAESIDDSQALQRYMAVNYPIELIQDEDAFVVSHPDLPGCVSYGDSAKEALDNLRDVKELWLEGQLASGEAIPNPSSTEAYSGKFVLRLPKMLHRLADLRARREGVSLNSYVTSVLAGALQFPTDETHRLRTAWQQSFHVSHENDAWRRGGVDDMWNIVDSAHAPKMRFYTQHLASQIATHHQSNFHLERYHHDKEEDRFVCR